MAEQAKLKVFLVNGVVMNTEDFDQVYQAVQPACYEVIRVIDGKALFLDAHYQRFVATLKSIGQEPPISKEDLAERITLLAAKNQVENYNVRLICNDFDNGGTVYLFFTHTSYPTEEMYRDGVKTDLLKMERKNPHAKIINLSLRETADALMREKGLFEAILVNELDQITEGSKSNIFFIRDGEVWTSPADGVLLGVTRQHILELCRNAGLTIREENIPVAELPEFTAAFISGTSPKVLPIRWIGGQELDVNDPVLRQIMTLYNQAIEEDLAG
jgi:branched-chain amino acid aminotransferase